MSTSVGPNYHSVVLNHYDPRNPENRRNLVKTYEEKQLKMVRDARERTHSVVTRPWIKDKENSSFLGAWGRSFVNLGIGAVSNIKDKVLSAVTDENGQFSLWKTAKSVAFGVALGALAVTVPVVGIGLAAYFAATTLPGFIDHAGNWMGNMMNGNYEMAENEAFHVGYTGTDLGLSMFAASKALKAVKPNRTAPPRPSLHEEGVASVAKYYGKRMVSFGKDSFHEFFSMKNWMQGWTNLTDMGKIAYYRALSVADPKAFAEMAAKSGKEPVMAVKELHQAAGKTEKQADKASLKFAKKHTFVWVKDKYLAELNKGKTAGEALDQVRNQLRTAGMTDRDIDKVFVKLDKHMEKRADVVARQIDVEEATITARNGRTGADVPDAEGGGIAQTAGDMARNAADTAKSALETGSAYSTVALRTARHFAGHTMREGIGFYKSSKNPFATTAQAGVLGMYGLDSVESIDPYAERNQRKLAQGEISSYRIPVHELGYPGRPTSRQVVEMLMGAYSNPMGTSANA